MFWLWYIKSMRKLGETFVPSMKRKIRGLTEAERREAFNTINYVPHTRVFKNKRGPANDNLNKCLQFLEVRAMERGGDCVMKNEQLMAVLKKSKRQVQYYINDLEKQGFITCLYADNPKETVVPVSDPDTFKPILKDGKIQVHKKNKRRLTYRIIRCHRIIAKNNYEVPHRKIDPKVRKHKPFKFDFRPPTETISFMNIPLDEYEKARLGDPAERNAELLLKHSEYEATRVKAMNTAFKNNLTLAQAEEKHLIPVAKPVTEIEMQETFNNLYERLAKIGEYAGPIYDDSVDELYRHYKDLQEQGDDAGIAVLGKECFKPKHLDAVPDHKAMYFTPKDTSDSSRFVSTDDPEYLFKMAMAASKR